MGALADQAKKMSNFLKILPGEETPVVYKGYKIIPSQFDPEKEVVQYIFEVDGEKKFWSNGSPKVAIFFDSKKEGDIINIKNVGNDEKAKYELTPVITQEKTK